MANGAEFTVLKVKLEKGAALAGKLPERLASIEPLNPQHAVNVKNPRVFSVTANRMEWGFNGRVFEMEEVAEDEVVKLGTTEVWQFENEATMGMMGGMPHPIHVHGVQYRVVGRSVQPGAKAVWNSLSAGFVDEGWKDVVLVMPGERVQVLIRFNDYPGLFVYHCHNLEHEDMGMMRNFLIKA